MSKNDTVLILRLIKDKKYIWIVLHVQSHECFGNDKWTRWWLFKQKSLMYSLSESLARHIASKINKQNNTEYGVILFYSNSNIEDFQLKNGKLIAPEIDIIEPPNHPDTSSPDDWVVIERL